MESAHSWGNTLAVTPAQGHEWYDLISEPFRSYGLPPVTGEELLRRYGRPTRSDGEEHFEYLLPTGKLWLRLDRDTSGSAVHEAWRLRFEPVQQTLLRDVIEEDGLACAEELLRDSLEFVILDNETSVPRVSVSVEQNSVERLTWMNLSGAPPSTP